MDDKQCADAESRARAVHSDFPGAGLVPHAKGHSDERLGRCADKVFHAGDARSLADWECQLGDFHCHNRVDDSLVQAEDHYNEHARHAALPIPEPHRLGRLGAALSAVLLDRPRPISAPLLPCTDVCHPMLWAGV